MRTSNRDVPGLLLIHTTSCEVSYLTGNLKETFRSRERKNEGRGRLTQGCFFFENVAANGEQMVVAGRNQGQVKKEHDSGCMKGKSQR